LEDHRLFAALGRFAVRFRWLIIVAWIAVTVVLTLSLPGLSTVEKTSNSEFLPASAASVQAGRLAQPFSSSTVADATYVAAVSHGSLTTADNDAVDRVEGAMRSQPGVTAVVDQGVSMNGRARAALVEVAMPANASGRQQRAAVVALRSTFATSAPPPGLIMHLTGSLAQNVDEETQSGQIQLLTELLSVLFILALLFLTFRALLAPLVALLPSAVALIASGPVIAASAISACRCPI
jgi:putative drug exporter of the RND superfamily